MSALIFAACPGPAASSKPLSPAAAEKVDTGSTPFVTVASRALPSLVTISVQRGQPVIPGVQFRNPLDRLFKRMMPPQQPEAEIDVLGSGTIFDERGYVLTNYHVVRGYTNLLVRLGDNTTFTGDQVKLVGMDEKSDLAVLKLATSRRLSALKFGDSDSIRVGEWAIAVGNPFGLQGTVTVGVVSAVGRSGLVFPEAPTYQDFIQTDASTNPGNSGGPLLNIRGEIIGINTAISSTGEGSVGIGFAIPSNTARAVSEQLIMKGKVVRGYLGITIQEITPDIKDAMGLTSTEGVVVTDVVEGSPAANAGIKAEDVITRLNGDSISSLDHFRETIADLAPGTSVRMTVLRGGHEQEVTAKLAVLPEHLAAVRPKPLPIVKASWLGLTVTDLSDSDRRASGLSKGVVVAAVENSSPADDAGILIGDIITTIDKQAVTEVNSFQAISRSMANSAKPVTFGIVRSKTRYSITVNPG